MQKPSQQWGDIFDVAMTDVPMLVYTRMSSPVGNSDYSPKINIGRDAHLKCFVIFCSTVIVIVSLAPCLID